MLLLMFVAIAGGLATSAALAKFGVMVALLGIPLGGSLCAAVAALVVSKLSASTDCSEDHLEAQTDAMVADLRSMAAQARRDDTSQAQTRQDGRRIA